ncbi:uncharacterized protein [Diadema antillarum]|uniref:uncharacterized protein n=1 Tax=Diadema antillarum TaxID=105358 RepID=UPI003A85A261
MAQDNRDVTATSKPRGSYLDPLKACALSGENGVPAGKSESATFAKYTTIIKQSRRNASRASVLNDVERSRFESIVKRMESEHLYHTAVLDRQKRQFRKSLEVLEKDRRAVKHYFDKGGNWVATPLKLVDGTTVKKRRGDKGESLLPPIDPLAAVQEANAGQQGANAAEDGTTVNESDGKRATTVDGSNQTSKGDEYERQVPDFPSRRLQSMHSMPALRSNSMPRPPQRFYTGDNIKTMRETLMSGTKETQTNTEIDPSKDSNADKLSLSI